MAIHVIPLDNDTIDQATTWAAENMIYSLEMMTENIAGKTIDMFSVTQGYENVTVSVRQAGYGAININLPMATALKPGLMSGSDKVKLTFTSQPVEGSPNGISSGAVYTAIEAAKAYCVGRIPKMVTLTSAEYQALVDAGTVDEYTYYFIAETTP